ncbi:MAG: hypothetical protein RLZZ324_790 [Candidatus Parcubacteria bacterium]|jgi:hypothetical protein
MTQLQLFFIAAFALAIAATLRRRRQGNISRKETIGWTALWMIAIVVVTRPEIASRAAAALGVGRGADAVVYVSVAALFYLVFRVFVRIDKLERDLTSVVRREALDHHRDGKRSS